MESAAIAEAHGHAAHPPEANRSSRIDPQLLGVLLFIISEAMLFGSFFTAYFFIRVVGNEPWPPEPFTFPVNVALMNTFILVFSSVVVHWALRVDQARQSRRPAGRAGDHVPDGKRVPGDPDQRILQGRLLDPRRLVRLRLLRPHRIARSPRFVGAHAARDHEHPHLRGHFSPEAHMGVEMAGIYWHFVDIMWIIVFLTVYIL